ncbi:carbohydrate ABC transporter permease [Geobacillus zalihae]|uniref:carbohydrate ABC transporter permease n=1 Tax=Geobacillus zalihae TaxID=213419 RepID=UPI000763D994|nr:sugar ABC transporter permease [Geobacillus zalihae]
MDTQNDIQLSIKLRAWSKKSIILGLFRKDITWAIVLLFPNLLGFLLFTFWPIIASFLLSFTEWDLLQPIKFVGLQNYINLFHDETFKKVFWNTLYFTIVSVPVGIVLSLLLAVALNQGLRGIKFYRTAYFLPVISSMVAVAVIWQWIYNPEYGVLNYFLGLFGIEGPSWLTSTKWAMPAVIMTSVWKNLGFNMLPESVTEVYQKCWETQSCRDFDSISNVHLLGEEPRVQYFVD